MRSPGSLRLGFSPCPNDTYIFHGLVEGLVDTPGFTLDVVLDDVEALNRAAAAGELDVVKVSYAAYGHLRDRYVALRAGGALGEGVGPLLVARRADVDLDGARVAIPGRWTTAALLLALVGPAGVRPVELRYDRIMPAVAAGEVDAGVIIHESRFTYPRYGLVAVTDLGAVWEQRTGLPLPLGAIVIRRELADRFAGPVEDAIRRSLRRARTHDDWWPYVRAHAAELDDDVIRAHIDLYVTDYTEDVGERGAQAVRALLDAAAARGLVPAHDAPLFWA